MIVPPSWAKEIKFRVAESAGIQRADCGTKEGCAGGGTLKVGMGVPCESLAKRWAEDGQGLAANSLLRA